MNLLGLPYSKKLPLRLVLIVPFVIQIFAAVGLVGYLSFKNGQKAVNDLANQLMSCKLGDWERSLVNPYVKNSSYIQSNQDAAEDNNQIGTNNKDLS